MALLGLGQVQKTSQVQTQKLSQRQIQFMNMLGMSSFDLRGEILKEIEENPALELVSDNYSDGTSVLRKKNDYKDPVRTGTVSAAGVQAAQDFQSMMESSPAPEETLQEHLLRQLNLTDVSDLKKKLCEKLIQNLDSNGHHIFAPDIFLDPANQLHTHEMLLECERLVQSFDPAGVCVKDVQESLFVQAKLMDNVPDLVLFILNGHLEFIVPPVAEKSRRKILEYIEYKNTLSFGENEEFIPEKKNVTPGNIESAIKLIQSLDPYPARGFGVSDSMYIRPDVYVRHEHGSFDHDDFEKGFVNDGEDFYFQIIPANDTIPAIRLAPDFKNAASAVKDKSQKDFLTSQIKAASAFIDSIDFRNQSIISACSRLVKIQADFFKNGPGYIVPLTQRQFAEEAGVHESTVSRIADSKFINCDWGTFPVKYFFSSAIKKQVTIESVARSDISTEVSSDTVRKEIEKILEEYNSQEKRLSDQKIADLLSQKGYKIARRTVAKYRSQLNIGSSYTR